MTHLAAGFLLGLAGSGHCLGMCGPLALFSGAPGERTTPRFVAHHASRLAVYLALGTAAGVAGGVLAEAGWRNWLAIAAGAVLIAHAIGLPGRVVGARPGRWFGSVASYAARTMPRHALARSATLGVLNGLMPCGLLYAALAAAAGLGNPLEAVGFMAAFGVGSLPAFGALAYSAQAFLPRVPRRLRQAAPIALAVLGLLLIARGAGPQVHEHLHSAMGR